MSEYIDREAAIDAVFGAMADGRAVFPALNNVPAADVVSRGAYDQTDWERCVALTQLKEIGKSLGERMDDMRPVVLCRDCKYYVPSGEADGERMCVRGAEWCAEVGCYYGFTDYTRPDYFCAGGEKREES